MSKTTNKDTSLRNFMLPDELYYNLEFIAESNNRDATKHIIHMLTEEAERFKQEKKLKKIPRTEGRKRKLGDES